jgi:hypothetical protein
MTYYIQGVSEIRVLNLTSERRLGRNILSYSTLENVDSVHDMILEIRRIGLKCITDMLNISHEYVFHVVMWVMWVLEWSEQVC